MARTVKTRSAEEIAVGLALAYNFERIRTERGAKGDKDLAKKIGIGHGSLSRVRLATHNTQLDTLAALARWAGIDVWQLLIPPPHWDEIKERAHTQARASALAAGIAVVTAVKRKSKAPA